MGKHSDCTALKYLQQHGAVAFHYARRWERDWGELEAALLSPLQSHLSAALTLCQGGISSVLADLKVKIS